MEHQHCLVCKTRGHRGLLTLESSGTLYALYAGGIENVIDVGSNGLQFRYRPPQDTNCRNQEQAGQTQTHQQIRPP